LMLVCLMSVTLEPKEAKVTPLLSSRRRPRDSYRQ